MSSSPLEQALGKLVADGTLSQDQAGAVAREVGSAALVPPVTGADLAAPAAAPRPGSHPQPHPDGRGLPAVLAEVGGYIGAAFVLAAAVVLTGPHWGRFGTAERLAILGVPALVLLAAAAAVLVTTPGGRPVVERPGTGARRRLAAALVVVAGGLAAGVGAVLARGTGDWQATWAFATAVVVGAVGYAAVRTPLLHAATGAAATALVGMAVGTAVGDWTRLDLVVGLSLAALGAVWAVLTAGKVLAEAGLGFTVAGAIGFLGGEYATVADDRSFAGYAVLAVVAAAGLLGYVRSRHVGVLVVGVVALGTVVPQAVIDYTDGALGAAGALLVTGLSILGASVLGLRLRGAVRTPPVVPPAAHA